jgi:hypothetical protein
MAKKKKGMVVQHVSLKDRKRHNRMRESVRGQGRKKKGRANAGDLRVPLMVTVLAVCVAAFWWGA